MRTAREQTARAANELEQHGWVVEMAETTQTGHGIRLAREAVARGFQAVIAVGGDGTVNEVANGVVDSPVALGALPLGTANVWAKEMGLPLGDIVSAARLLADSDVRLIDVGQVRGPTIAPRIFVLWSGVGLDALITQDIEPQREMKRRFGALYFWLVGIRDACTFRGKRAVLQIGNRRMRKRIILALAANAQLYGGVVRIAPGARLDDGSLDLVVFKGTGFWATALHLVRVFLGMHLRDPRVEDFRFNCMNIDGKNLAVHVDGEPIGYAPVEIRVRPAALHVLVPKTANPSLFAPTT